MSMTDDAARRGESLSLEQRASLGSFLGLSLKNGLLNIITLTLYRFWGKTEVRRRVWSTTYLNGEPLEYTGRGVELFMGFLFALAAFGVPFLLLTFGVQLLGPAAAALLAMPFYLLMFFLFGFGMFTALRYMASRTVWRGVRFELQGSPSTYGTQYLGYVMLSAVTLGWYWPAASRRLAEPLWGGLHFGDRPLRFDMAAAQREKIYPAYALAWFGGAVMYVFVIVLAVALSYAQKESGGSEAMVGVIYLAILISLPFWAVVFAPYQAARLRSVAAGVKFGEVSFRLNLKWWDMAWLTVSNIAMAALSLGFLMPLVQARTSKFLISRLSSEGAVDLTSVRQAERGPRTAEGLADAFGMAPI